MWDFYRDDKCMFASAKGCLNRLKYYDAEQLSRNLFFCLILLGKAFWFLGWKAVPLWHVLHADVTLLARLGGQHIHKRRYWTLWFWRYKNLASSSVSQKQSNGNAPRVFYMHSHYCILPARCKKANYIQTSAWGFRRCSFRLTGQCESLYSVERVTDWLHVFLCICVTMKNKCC